MIKVEWCQGGFFVEADSPNEAVELLRLVGHVVCVLKDSNNRIQILDNGRLAANALEGVRERAPNTGSPKLPPIPCLSCELMEYCRECGIQVYSTICKGKYHQRQLRAGA
jgi:hypothetical protein